MRKMCACLVILAALLVISSRSHRESHFEGLQGYRLENSVIGSYPASTPIDCAMKCSSNSTCKSLNYQHSNGDVNQCYLSNMTRRSALASLIVDPRYTYYEKDPCDSSPCIFGSCFKSPHDDGFVCKCSRGYKGLTCETERLGWLSQKPALSCQDIKLKGEAMHDGKYWIDPENSGNAIQVYCDMNHEGGGWLLVTNVLLHDAVKKPTLTLRTSYRDISNYNDNKTIISSAVLRKLRELIAFQQVRFHCYQQKVNRTVHIITSKTSNGSAVVEFMSEFSNTRPESCWSFYKGSDDNSLLANHCDSWRDKKWGHYSRINSWRLNDHTFYVPQKYHWILMSQTLLCDSRYEVISIGDFWKIYIR